VNQGREKQLINQVEAVRVTISASADKIVNATTIGFCNYHRTYTREPFSTVIRRAFQEPSIMTSFVEDFGGFGAVCRVQSNCLALQPF
jgi:hypothetical protein